jgi:putative membrane protein
MRREPLVLLIVGAVAFVALGIAPTADRFTWLMENLPTLIGVPILVATWRRFPLTPLLYRLMLVHALVLMIGGHWTYARVPAGDWVRDWLHLQRNPYDRLGHLMQGFVPVILFRELLLRKGVLTLRGAWTAAVLLFMVLGLSAAYELIEWLTAEATGEKADDFLGTQGDPWDTQWDMCCALIGSSVSLLLLTRLHDRQLAKLALERPA